MATSVNITVSAPSGNPLVQIVRVSGELDESNLPQLESVVNPLLASKTNHALVLDFEGLEFMSSKIIGYLSQVLSLFL